MASYRDKINQEKLSTESGRIAFAIQILNNPTRYGLKWNEFIKDGIIAIYDGIRVEKAPIGIYVEKWSEQYFDWMYKIVRGIDYDEDVAMLNAQTWRM